MPAFLNDAAAVTRALGSRTGVQVLCVCALCILAAGCSQSAGQVAAVQKSEPSSLAPATTPPDRTAFERGVRAMQQERYREAQMHLAPLARRRPPPHHPVYGSPARWLGRVLLQRGDTARARQAWLQGVRDAETSTQTAVGAADALLQSMDTDAIHANTEAAVYAFEHIIRALSAPVSEAEEEVLRRHMAQLALIVPDSIARPLSARIEGRRAPSELSISPLLMRWLRVQDPVLATERNERVIEHLTRVRTAEENYAWSERSSGLDDRGERKVYSPFAHPR